MKAQIKECAKAIGLGILAALVLIAVFPPKARGEDAAQAAERVEQAPKMPMCPVVFILPVQDADGTWYFVLTEEALEQVRLRMEGLEQGTCDPGQFWGIDARLIPQ